MESPKKNFMLNLLEYQFKPSLIARILFEDNMAMPLSGGGTSVQKTSVKNFYESYMFGFFSKAMTKSFILYISIILSIVVTSKTPIFKEIDLTDINNMTDSEYKQRYPRFLALIVLFVVFVYIFDTMIYALIYACLFGYVKMKYDENADATKITKQLYESLFYIIKSPEADGNMSMYSSLEMYAIFGTVFVYIVYIIFVKTFIYYLYYPDFQEDTEKEQNFQTKFLIHASCTIIYVLLFSILLFISQKSNLAQTMFYIIIVTIYASLMTLSFKFILKQQWLYSLLILVVTLICIIIVL